MAEQQFLLNLKSFVEIEQSDKADIEALVNRFIEQHRQNHTYITQLTIESVTALTSADARAKALERQGFGERFRSLLTGRNQKVQAEIHRDFARTQYASQQLIQQLAAQNLMTFELVTAVNNKLNTLILEQDQEINEIYKLLERFFKQIRAELSKIQEFKQRVELLEWSHTIEYQMYDGKEYAHLSDVEKIVCITNDFFCLTKGLWKTSDWKTLKKSFAEIGLPVENTISIQSFFAELLSKPQLIDRLFENVTKDGLQSLQAYDTPLLKGIEKLEYLNSCEAYIVETIAKFLTKRNIFCSQEEIRLSLVENYLKQEAYVKAEKAINLFDLILDILNGLRMIGDMNDNIKTPINEPITTSLELKEFSFETVTVTHHSRIDKEIRTGQQLVFDIGNSMKLEMVYIPGGTFLMGSPENERGRSPNEGPQHRVMIQPFYMGKYLVTQSQWEALMENNPSHFKGVNRPVECVSWDDTQEFLRRLNVFIASSSPIIRGEEGICRLPSESEWEYACRAGATTPFTYGEILMPELANYDKKYYETTDVGKFPPNKFGLHDMHGNVGEWCMDTWHENYNGAPNNGSVWGISGNRTTKKISRGGTWYDPVLLCRCAYRGVFESTYCSQVIGFRIVLGVA